MRSLKREPAYFAELGPSAMLPARQMPLRSAPLPPRNVYSSLYPEREFPSAYAAPPRPLPSMDPYYDDAPIAKNRRMLPPTRTVDAYARPPPGIKQVTSSGITRQALNAGSSGFSTTNSVPLGGRPMRIGPANPPPPSLGRYGTPPAAQLFPERSVRMPIRGFAGRPQDQRGKRSLSQIAPPIQSTYSHTGASFTKF